MDTACATPSTKHTLSEESPSRRFGNPSRLVNRKPYSKPSPSPKIAGKVDKCYDDQATQNVPPSDATQALLELQTPVSPPRLAEHDLNLPPFKIETGGTNSAFLLRPVSPPREAPVHVIPGPFAAENEVIDEPGMPTRDEFGRITEAYLRGLHERKREKALITTKMHKDIFDTLTYPDATRIGSPQFRFWARKMFQLVEAEKIFVITHGGRPVAVKEQIYTILCMSHRESGHAGRDKTCKVLREYYTWIPKELTANFVKACPTCIEKRSKESVAKAKLAIKEAKAKAKGSAAVPSADLSQGSGHSFSRGSHSGSFISGGSASSGSFNNHHEDVRASQNVFFNGNNVVNEQSYAPFTYFTQSAHIQTHHFLQDGTLYTIENTPDFSAAQASSTPFPPTLNFDGTYQRTPVNPMMTPLPPLMQYLENNMSPSIDSQAVLPRIRLGGTDVGDVEAHTATNVPIDPILLAGALDSAMAGQQVKVEGSSEHVHLHAPQPASAMHSPHLLLSPDISWGQSYDNSTSDDSGSATLMPPIPIPSLSVTSTSSTLIGALDDNTKGKQRMMNSPVPRTPRNSLSNNATHMLNAP